MTRRVAVDRAGSTTDTVFINGKFTAQRTTGVQRVAQNLLRALDARLATGEPRLLGPMVLLLPPGARAPDLRCIEARSLGRRAMPLSLWEQCLLPLAVRGGLLLNLSGSAPLLVRRQACLIHDAAVFDRPQAYSATFRHWYRALFRVLSRRHATLFTVSAFSQQRLAANLGIAASQIGIVPNGGEHLQGVAPDVTVLARYALEPGRYFMAVGSANPNKNFDVLQVAFARLSMAPGVKLVIVGSADTRGFSSQRPRDAANVVRTGPLDDAQLKALYQHAASLVFPSLYEGFGLPPLEAMSCGCPVAASNAAAVPEVCRDAALYFDPESPEQITAAMQRLLEDAALRDRLRRAGAHQVKHFRWDAAAQVLLGHLHAARDDGRFT